MVGAFSARDYKPSSGPSCEALVRSVRVSQTRGEVAHYVTNKQLCDKQPGVSPRDKNVRGWWAHLVTSYPGQASTGNSELPNIVQSSSSSPAVPATSTDLSLIVKVP